MVGRGFSLHSRPSFGVCETTGNPFLGVTEEYLYNDSNPPTSVDEFALMVPVPVRIIPPGSIFTMLR